MHVNHKRVHREAGLLIRRKRRKRLLRAGFARPVGRGANQKWALDFGTMRRRAEEVSGVERDRCVRAGMFGAGSGHEPCESALTRELERIVAERGAQGAIRCDNGPEFTSRHILGWALERKIELVHIELGRPMQNGYVESFHGTLRDECLNASWFGNLFEAR